MLADLMKDNATTGEMLARQSAAELKGKQGEPLRFAYCSQSVHDGIARACDDCAVWNGEKWVTVFTRTIMPEFPWVYTGGNNPLVNGKPFSHNWTEAQ